MFVDTPKQKHRYFRDTETDSESDFETPAFQSKPKSNAGNGNDGNEPHSDGSDHDIGSDVETSSEEELLKNSVSGDDSSPEDVSFSSSRLSALEKMKQAMKQIDSEKDKKKEKRKHLQEKYKQQKKMKTNLEESKLPEEFFENLSEEFFERKNIPSKNLEVIDSPDSGTSSTMLSEEDSPVCENYIPLGMNKRAGINVRVVKEEENSIKKLCKNVLDFKHNMMYGGRIRRESTKVRLGKLQKRKANRR
ncbi:hypothetical protein ScPMuIL_009184 [Solemya velum]